MTTHNNFCIQCGATLPESLRDSTANKYPTDDNNFIIFESRCIVCGNLTHTLQEPTSCSA